MSLSIRVDGDQDYLALLKALAAKRQVPISRLVRQAIDIAYSTDMQQIQALFFASDAAYMQHVVPTPNTFNDATKPVSVVPEANNG